MKLNRIFVLLAALFVAATVRADSLELKNGSLIKGRFLGGNEDEISFQVGSSVQKFKVQDVSVLKFDSETNAREETSREMPPREPSLSERPPRPASFESREPSTTESSRGEHAREGAFITIPVGTHISVRTIDGIDSTTNHVGDRFQASLEEPLTVDGNIVVDKGADIYGRLAESKESGTFSGRSQLRLELTGIVVNGQTVPLVTGDYELTGKSRTASTAKRTVGGAAVGSIIGAIAGGGKGAAIGAGVGGGVGAGSEVVTKGDQVKVPSESLLDFTLQQEVSIPKPRG